MHAVPLQMLASSASGRTPIQGGQLIMTTKVWTSNPSDWFVQFTRY